MPVQTGGFKEHTCPKDWKDVSWLSPWTEYSCHCGNGSVHFLTYSTTFHVHLKLMLLFKYNKDSIVSTKAYTKLSSTSRPVQHGNHYNPPVKIPVQLAAYSAHALSTALFMLGTHFAAG